MRNFLHLFSNFNPMKLNKSIKSVFVILVLVLSSCHSTYSMKYDIDGISAEGAEAEVSYRDGKISQSITHIYGETGRASIAYHFEKDKIKVLEKMYSYKTAIDEVKSDKDMVLDYEISYFIDYNGKVIGKENPDRFDIFTEFKEAVPFEIKTKK